MGGMPVSSPQLPVRLRAPEGPTVLRALAALLLAALPGALLICILHCSISAYAHQHHGHVPSPFLCNHSLDAASDTPPALSLSLLTSLVQSLPGVAPLMIAAGLLGPLIGASARALHGRPAETPPPPPPRCRTA